MYYCLTWKNEIGSRHYEKAEMPEIMSCVALAIDTANGNGTMIDTIYNNGYTNGALNPVYKALKRLKCGDYLQVYNLHIAKEKGIA